MTRSPGHHAIFICYRHSDSPDLVGRIYDHLTQAFGDGAVFRDVESIAGGSNFVATIQEALAHSQVGVVMLGNEWAGILERNAQQNPDALDYVRIECEQMLTKPGFQVVTCCLNEARVPDPLELPPELRTLSEIQACHVHSGHLFKRDMEALIDLIRAKMERAARGPRKKQTGGALLAWSIGIVLIAATAWLTYSMTGGRSGASNTQKLAQLKASLSQLWSKPAPATTTAKSSTPKSTPSPSPSKSTPTPLPVVKATTPTPTPTPTPPPPPTPQITIMAPGNALAKAADNAYMAAITKSGRLGQRMEVGERLLYADKTLVGPRMWANDTANPKEGWVYVAPPQAETTDNFQFLEVKVSDPKIKKLFHKGRKVRTQHDLFLRSDPKLYPKGVIGVIPKGTIIEVLEDPSTVAMTSYGGRPVLWAKVKAPVAKP